MEHMDNFSPREVDVIRLLLLGKSNKQIAHALGISERTVEFHLNHIFEKMAVNSRVELILKLGKSTGEFSAQPEESTVAGGEPTGHTGKRIDARDRPEENLDKAAPVKIKEFAMNLKLDTILPLLVILVGLILITAGIVTHKYGAVVVGIIVAGAAAYRLLSESGKKKESKQ